MSYFRTGMLKACGRVIGCAVAYALLINLILAGVLGAQNASAEVHGGSAFELCLTGPDGQPLPGDGNAGHAAKIHCVLCVTGGQLAAGPVVFATVELAQAVTRIAAKPAYDSLALSPVDHRSTSQRGPPQQA